MIVCTSHLRNTLWQISFRDLALVFVCRRKSKKKKDKK